MPPQAALDAHRALGLRHISRVDLIVDGAGTPWFLEANVLPGLTETSLLPQALEAAGHDLGWVYSGPRRDGDPRRQLRALRSRRTARGASRAR